MDTHKKWTDRHSDMYTVRQIASQTDKQTDTQKNRQTIAQCNYFEFINLSYI